MAKNETTAALSNLYKVTYQYVAPNGFLRQGSIVIEAETEEKAKADALSRIPTDKQRHPKVASVTKY